MQVSFFTFLVLLAAFTASAETAVKRMMLLSVLGASSAVALTAIGGANITPAAFFLPFLVVIAFAKEGPRKVFEQLAFPNAGFWLMLVVIYGFVSAFVLPRVFEGEVLIRTMDRNSTAGGSAVPLRPVSTNLTQAVYALGALACFACSRALLDAPGRLLKFRDAVMALAIVNIVGAAIDMVETNLGMQLIMEFVRNAEYTIHTGAETGGLRRVSGTFPEASMFAIFTLPLFAFAYSLWKQGDRPRMTGFVALVSFLLLIVSTATTAYVALGIYCGFLAVSALLHGLRGRRTPKLGFLFSVAWLLAVAACLIVLLKPAFFDAVRNFFEVTLFSKLESASGRDRGDMNLRAWLNFVDTWGIGVGLGSARASSYLLVLLSNVGIFGTLCYFAFIWRAWRASSNNKLLSPDELKVSRAAAQALLAGFIGASVSGSVFELGQAFYAFAAAAAVSTSAARFARVEPIPPARPQHA
jgi:hypothetical protein